MALAVVLTACEPRTTEEADLVTALAGEKKPQRSEIELLIEDYFGPATHQAMKIVECESSFNPNAISRTNDHGLFQINRVHRDTWPKVTGHPWSARYNAELNTKFARYLYDQRGWQPWTCRKVL